MSQPTPKESRVLIEEQLREIKKKISDISNADESGEFNLSFSNAIKDGVWSLLFVCSLWSLITGDLLPRTISSIVLGVALGRYFANQFSLAENLPGSVMSTENINSANSCTDTVIGEKAPTVFLSYSRKDKEYVERLIEILTEEGFSVWLDDRIDYGAFWSRVIEEKLAACEVFVVVMTPRSRESHWVTCELNYALENRKLIFPILLEGSRWLDVASVQTFDVKDRSLPSEKFFDTMRFNVLNLRSSSDAS